MLKSPPIAALYNILIFSVVLSMEFSIKIFLPKFISSVTLIYPKNVVNVSKDEPYLSITFWQPYKALNDHFVLQ